MEEGIEEGSIGDTGASDTERVRAQLRKRWELASVINFLRVFRPVIRGNIEVTGEEVEEGLICPNDVLVEIHIALLKGIPPVSKNVDAPDLWVTLVCKQIDLWWSWVAEGDAPLAANRGAEVSMYKNLDPLSRLMILKALCEIRAVQDDIISYIDATLKDGSPLSTFRKDKIGTDSDGNDYWWDGDNIMGYRLYRESTTVTDYTQKLKDKSCFTKPRIDFHWETIACDLEQFQDISVKLSESKVFGDVEVANILKTKIIPLVVKLQKKKERAQKRRQRKAVQSTGFLVIAVGSRRSCRDRKPATYTFDEYDRSIDEAIQIERKRKAAEMYTGTQNEAQASLQEVTDDEKPMASGSEDEDYHEKNDKVDDDYSEVDLDEDLDNPATKQMKPTKIIFTPGLRRSMRNVPYPNQHYCAASNEHAEMNNRLRQRPVHNTDCTMHMVPDSEEENSEDDTGKPVDVILHAVSGASPVATTVR